MPRLNHLIFNVPTTLSRPKNTGSKQQIHHIIPSVLLGFTNPNHDLAKFPICHISTFTSTKIIFVGTLFFSQAVHNFTTPVEKIMWAHKENRPCKCVFSDGSLNSTAYVNGLFTQAVYNNNHMCKCYLHSRLP
jgi:hypothetical protein